MPLYVDRICFVDFLFVVVIAGLVSTYCFKFVF